MSARIRLGGRCCSLTRTPIGVSASSIAFVSAAGALSLRVLMRRKSLADLTDETLININLKTVNGEPFSATGNVSATGTISGNINELSLVDNSKYQYFIQAPMSNAPADLQIDFYAFQIAYSLG